MATSTTAVSYSTANKSTDTDNVDENAKVIFVSSDSVQEPVLEKDGLAHHDDVISKKNGIESYSRTKGSTVSFHNIVYTVNTKIDGKKAKKNILDDISGIFAPGINAILGPTGSGKTSLLDVLAGRKDPRGLNGNVLIDGQKQPRNFKCMSGYVVQDDVVMGTLTIRENLAFSAALRLPKTIKKQERAKRVDEVISELGLTSVADSKVGTVFIRGISGGERKRTNIGMELIIQPGVLFLDEPTTGLDASTANAVMLLLKKLANNGRCIILSIHQPRYSIYRVFDTLHLLSHGHTVYHGPNQQALDYFSNIGYFCEEHNNPPDFFLDVINGDSTAVAAVQDKLDEVEQGRGYTTGDNLNSEKLHELFSKSTANHALATKLTPIANNLNENGEVSVDNLGYACGFFTQLGHLSKRTVKNLIRNPFISVMQMVIMLIFAAVVGVIYWQVDDSLSSGIQNRVGAFFFIIMNMVFGNLSAVELFIQERVIFIHESASGYYRVSSYFLAKVFCDLIPMRIIPTTIFATVTYFMIGFQLEVDNFFIYLLNLVLTAICASSLAFCLSSLVSVAALANLFISLCYVFMMVFSGFLVNLSTIAVWLRWLSYLSIFKYSLDTLSAVELRDLVFCDYEAPPTMPGVSNTTSAPIEICQPGTAYLDNQGIDYTDWGIWSNQVALASMSVILLFLTYINLRRIPKLK